MGAAAARHARESFDVSSMVRAYEEVYEDQLALSQLRNVRSFVRGPAIPAEEEMASHHH
jgi:hypothetical protein